MTDETKEFWDPNGSWKCICVTPTHKRGQRFSVPQCTYCLMLYPKPTPVQEAKSAPVQPE